MIPCPYCETENIEGVDLCEQCGQALVDEHLPTPNSRLERALLRDRVRDLQPKKPIVVPPTMKLKDVIHLLVNKKIGCVFIVEGDRVSGVFTERDALMRVGVQAHELQDRPISEFATSNPHDLDQNAKVAFVVRMMDLGGYRHAPIVDEEGHLAGVISVRDILRYLTEHTSAVGS